MKVSGHWVVSYWREVQHGPIMVEKNCLTWSLNKKLAQNNLDTLLTNPEITEL